MKNIIKEEIEKFIDEMSTKAPAPIEDDGYWKEMIEKAKEKFDVDNVEVVNFNSDAPKVRIVKSGFKPVIIWKVKPEHKEYLINGKYFEHISDWLLSDAIPNAVNHFQSKEKNIKKLSPTASIGDKIEMLRLVGYKANKMYHSRKHSEFWQGEIWRNYGHYWNELYDAVKDTPEWEQYRKENNIARDIDFSDILA